MSEDRKRQLNLELSIFEMLKVGFGLQDRQQRAAIAQVIIQRDAVTEESDAVAYAAMQSCRKRLGTSDNVLHAMLANLAAPPDQVGIDVAFMNECQKIYDDIKEQLMVLELSWCLGRAFIPPEGRPIDYVLMTTPDWPGIRGGSVPAFASDSYVKGISGKVWSFRQCQALPYVLGHHHLIRLADEHQLPELMRIIDSEKKEDR